jgi:hypothetical protein
MGAATRRERTLEAGGCSDWFGNAPVSMSLGAWFAPDHSAADL